MIELSGDVASLRHPALIEELGPGWPADLLALFGAMSTFRTGMAEAHRATLALLDPA